MRRGSRGRGQGRYFIGAKSKNGGCRDIEIDCITIITLDCDNRGEWHALRAVLDQAGIGYVVQRSSSHAPPDIVKWHITIALTRPWAGEKPTWRVIWRVVVGFFAAIGKLTVDFDFMDPVAGTWRPNYGFDHATDRLGQPIFCAAKRNKEQSPPETIFVAGKALDLDKLLVEGGVDPTWYEAAKTKEVQARAGRSASAAGMSSVTPQQRFTREHPCPICTGYEALPRGQGERCVGFLSVDGDWCRCSREEHAGALASEDSGAGPLYVHRMYGSCRCGVTHAADHRPSSGGSVEATYDYRDERCDLLFQVVRKAGKRFLQRRLVGGQWAWHLSQRCRNGSCPCHSVELPKMRSVLYRLPEVLAADSPKAVYVAEGEKDVDALVRHGLLATCNPGGAGKWKLVAGHAAGVLHGRKVVVIADADDPGRGHAQQVAAALHEHAESVRVIEAPQGKDPADFFALGGDAASLEATGKAASAWKPAQATTTNGAAHLDVFERGDHVELGECMLARLEGDGPRTVFADLDLHKYNPASGLWHPIQVAAQSCTIQDFAGATVVGPKPRKLRIRAPDVSGARTLAAHRREQIDFFFEAPRGIVFTNGFVQVSADEGVRLRSHAPENRARHGYDFAFESGATPLAWLKFLYALFRDDEDREEKILFVQEFFGASLLGIAPRYQRCVMAIGGGENGKSKLGDIILACLPKDSYCSIPPHTFGTLSGEYTRAMLAGKLLNVVNELPDADIIAAEQFKAIVTGEPVHARRIREAPFSFRPSAGHYFAANRLPGTMDHSHGFWRRWIVLSFNRNFCGDAERDADIAEKIIGAERPAIVPWLLLGGVRVMKQGGYTIPSSHSHQVKAWRSSADQVALFIEERCVASTDERPRARTGHDWTGAETLYDAYTVWSHRNGHRPVASNKFGMRMKELGRGSHHTNVGSFYPVRLRRPDEVTNSVTDSGSGPSQESEGDANDYN